MFSRNQIYFTKMFYVWRESLSEMLVAFHFLNEEEGSQTAVP